ACGHDVGVGGDALPRRVDRGDSTVAARDEARTGPPSDLGTVLLRLAEDGSEVLLRTDLGIVRPMHRAGDGPEQWFHGPRIVAVEAFGGRARPGALEGTFGEVDVEGAALLVPSLQSSFCVIGVQSDAVAGQLLHAGGELPGPFGAGGSDEAGEPGHQSR